MRKYNNAKYFSTILSPIQASLETRGKFLPKNFRQKKQKKPKKKLGDLVGTEDKNRVFLKAMLLIGVNSCIQLQKK